jgi:hypothetical protein
MIKCLRKLGIEGMYLNVKPIYDKFIAISPSYLIGKNRKHSP